MPAKKFVVREVLERTIEAEDYETVKQGYDDGDIVLGAEDFVNVEIIGPEELTDTERKEIAVGLLDSRQVEEYEKACKEHEHAKGSR